MQMTPPQSPHPATPHLRALHDPPNEPVPRQQRDEVRLPRQWRHERQDAETYGQLAEHGWVVEIWRVPTERKRERERRDAQERVEQRHDARGWPRRHRILDGIPRPAFA